MLHLSQSLLKISNYIVLSEKKKTSVSDRLHILTPYLFSFLLQHFTNKGKKMLMIV